MFRMQYFMPPNFPIPDGRFDRAAAALGPSLKDFDTKGAYVPNSALWVRLKVTPDRSLLEIKKRGQLVYINVLCTSAMDAPRLLVVVQLLYDQYDLGTPIRPTVEAWIHSIPVGYHLLRQNEVQLCEKLTVAIFYAVFGRHEKKSNSLN